MQRYIQRHMHASGVPLGNVRRAVRPICRSHKRLVFLGPFAVGCLGFPEAAFQARKTKPEEPNQSPDKVSLSQETMVLGLYDPPITQSAFEQAMKDWPEEPDSYRDPSQEAEEEAPPGYLLVWDLLSPLQKWIIKQNPRVRDGLQPCGRPVSNSKSK